MRNITLSALTALSMVVLANPALAETSSISVPFGDLDLSSPGGMQTLDGRINAAAGRICGTVKVRSVSDGTEHARCMQQTHASVAIQVARLSGNARVLALNTAGQR